MKHRELVDKVMELEDRIRRIEESNLSIQIANSNPAKEIQEIMCKAADQPIDQAYDPQFTQLDIDPDYQG